MKESYRGLAIISMRAEILLWQDDASYHSAKEVKQWVRDCQVDFFEDWPRNSHDSIENCWALMKRKLQKENTALLEDLTKAVTKVWRELDNQWLRNLVELVPNRLKACVKRKGRSTGY